MKYEDLIAAKVRMAEMDATIAIWIGAVLVLLALCCIGRIWQLFRDDSYSGDALPLLAIVALVMLCVGVPTIGNGIYTMKTAEMQARADLANYQLVELKK